MSDVLQYKGYAGSVEYSAEERCLHGKVLCIDSLLMYDGANVDELETAFRETVDGYLALCARKGISPNKPYSGNFNVRVPEELHRVAALEAAKRGVKLNTIVRWALEKALYSQQSEKHFHIHIEKMASVPSSPVQDGVRWGQRLIAATSQSTAIQ